MFSSERSVGSQDFEVIFDDFYRRGVKHSNKLNWTQHQEGARKTRPDFIEGAGCFIKSCKSRTVFHLPRNTELSYQQHRCQPSEQRNYFVRRSPCLSFPYFLVTQSTAKALKPSGGILKFSRRELKSGRRHRHENFRLLTPPAKLIFFTTTIVNINHVVEDASLLLIQYLNITWEQHCV